MRPDMHELLVERPRRAHGERYPRGYVRNKTGGHRDDAPLREPLSRSRYGDKTLSENFAPLVRFLRSNVGRPWSKVHSEMAKVLAPTNAVQRHVLDHLADFLSTNVWEIDGELWSAHKRYPPSPLRASRRDQFYVHPRTGLLSVVLHRRRTKPHAIVLSPAKEIRRLNGHWYELTMALTPPWPKSEQCIDVILGRARTYRDYELYPELADIWSSGRHVVARRQITKRELRAALAR